MLGPGNTDIHQASLFPKAVFSNLVLEILTQLNGFFSRGRCLPPKHGEGPTIPPEEVGQFASVEPRFDFPGLGRQLLVDETWDGD